MATQAGPYGEVHRNASGITWAQLYQYASDLEQEFGCTVFMHVWPDKRLGGRWCFMVRGEAVRVGGGYRGKAQATYHEYWPNGRVTTMVGAWYRVLLELWATLDDQRERERRDCPLGVSK